MTERSSERSAPRPKRDQALRARFKARLLGEDEAALSGALIDLIGTGDGYSGELLAGAERQRISFDAQSPFTVVIGPKTSLFWENETGLAAELPALDPSTLGPSRWRLEGVQRNAERQEATATCVLSDPSIGVLRQEVTLTTDPELAPFGPAVAKAVFGGSADGNGEDWVARIGAAGVPVRQRCITEDGSPVSEMALEIIGVERVEPAEFALPRRARNFLDLIADPEQAEVDPSASEAEERAADEEQVATIEQALGSEGVTRSQTIALLEEAMQDCLGSSRGGGFAASLTQDALSLAAGAVNTFAPLIGSTTITSDTYPGPGGASTLQGRWVIPWLANMAALPRTGPGSGIFCLLRSPRRLTTSPGGVAGGEGLLDRLAWRALSSADGSGMLLTQRLFTAGTLASELAKWGASAPAAVSPLWSATSARLMAASGNLLMVSADDQRVIVEGYEASEYGTFSVDLNIQTTAFEFGAIRLGRLRTPPLYVIRLSGITGTANFTGLVAPVISSARIGSTGNLVLGVTPPAITLDGVVARAPTPFADLIAGLGMAGIAVTMPFLVPVAATLLETIRLIAINVSRVSARTVGVRWTFDVSWAFDTNTGRLEPTVSLLSQSGSVLVLSRWVTPNILANVVEQLVLAFGSLFGTWAAEVANAAARGLQAALRAAGFELPVGRQFGLKATGGSASSTTDRILNLEVDIAPDVLTVMSRSFQTQTLTREKLGLEVRRAVTSMRDDINGTPLTPPALPTLRVGVLAGLGVSQNALNTYVLAQWATRIYEATVSDPAVMMDISAKAPQLATQIGTTLAQLGIWAATPPRVEVAPGAVTAAGRPLVVIFDDVRICMRAFKRQSMAQNAVPTSPSSVGELSFSFSVPASAHLAWPWVMSVDLLRSASAIQLEAVGAWELVDPKDSFVMEKVPEAELRAIALIAAPFLLGRGIGTPGTPITDARTWSRTAPAVQEQTIGIAATGGLAAQRLYMELLTVPQRGLVVVPGLETTLLELFDGSGAPTLLTLSGAPAGTSLGTLNCAQGSQVRDLVFGLSNLLPLGP